MAHRILAAAALLGSPLSAAAQPTTPFYILEGQTRDAKLGAYVAAVPDTNGDGVDELVSGNHRYDGAGGVDSGRVLLFDGATGKVLWTVDGERAGGLLGHDVWGIGDVNGDGRGDVIASAYRYTFPGVPARRQAGKAYLLSGKDGTILWTRDGEKTGDELGFALASVPDLDNDKIDDVVIGAWLSDDGAYLAGKAYVCSGKTGKVLRTHLGMASNDRLGCAVAGFHDLDGDGHGDYAVAAQYAGPNREGQVYVFSGKTGGLLRTYTGEASGDLFGQSVTSVPDTDGDRRDDILIGAPHHDPGGTKANAGRAYLLSGRTGVLLHTFDGERPGDKFGRFGTGLADADGDGRGEVAVGAPNYSGSGPLLSGAAYLFSGKTGTRLRRYVGEAAYNLFGFALCGLNDVNGDGRGDLVVGAFQYRPNPTHSESYGRIYVYTDGLTSSVTSLSVSAGGRVPLEIDAGPRAPLRAYLVVASLAGAYPGFDLGRLHVPLNFDLFTALSWSFANTRILVNTFGKTGAKGRASAAFQAPPNLLAGYAGQTLTFVCVLVDRLNLVSNPLSVALKP